MGSLGPAPIAPRRATRFAALLVAGALVVSGCAHPLARNDWATYSGPGKDAFQQEELRFPAVADPIEPFNRTAAGVNRAVLFGVIDPLAQIWRRLVPQVVRDALVRAANNSGYPARCVNNLLQGKWRGAGVETARFLANSTVGVLGMFDVASDFWQLEPHDEDMGQTFARWGWSDSPYLVLPLGGPSTVRDSVGLLGDWPLDPLAWFFPAAPIKAFIVRAEQVEGAKRLITTRLDAYQPARLVWVLNRRVLTGDYAYPIESNGATQTAGAVFLEFHDPYFPGRGRVHEVQVASTAGKLPYRVWLQPKPAPLVFIVPGLGTHRESASTIALAEMAFRRGFSAVTISSAFNFEFMQNAATTTVPGFAPVDARDVHMALDAIDRDLARRHPGRITGRVLMGLSMGAFHALFIAAAEDGGDGDLVRFDRYVALYPPVKLETALHRLDAFYNAPLAFPPNEREDRVLGILQKVVATAKSGDLQPGTPIPLSTLEAEFLIGLAFRLVLHDMIWTSQERNDLGVLQTERSSFRRASASEEILEFSYLEYLYAFALPYYRDLDPELDSVTELFRRSDLRAIAPALRANGKIRVFANANDFLVTPDDVGWLTELLGASNVTFYTAGGHMGNLYQVDVQNDVMDSLADLLW